MLSHSKKKRRRFHVLKKTIVFLLGMLEERVEHHNKERVREFARFLQDLYE